MKLEYGEKRMLAGEAVLTLDVILRATESSWSKCSSQPIFVQIALHTSGQDGCIISEEGFAMLLRKPITRSAGGRANWGLTSVWDTREWERLMNCFGGAETGLHSQTC